MDFSRLRQGELIAGIGGIALIVFMFFDWYTGVSGYQTSAGLLAFVVMLAGITAVKFAALAAMGKRLNIPVRRGGITLVLSALAGLIVVYTLLASEFENVEFGLFLGLAAIIAIAVGTLLALREDGWEPLVGDGRTAPTRSVASSAPTRKAPATKKSAAKKSAAKKSAAKKSAARR